MQTHTLEELERLRRRNVLLLPKQRLETARFAAFHVFIVERRLHEHCKKDRVNPISTSPAYNRKKTNPHGRHRDGSEVERLLAQSNPNKLKPHTRFAFTAPAAAGVSADAMGGNGALPMAPPPPMAHLNGG